MLVLRDELETRPLEGVDSAAELIVELDLSELVAEGVPQQQVA
jgi:hypothetical protein